MATPNFSKNPFLDYYFWVQTVAFFWSPMTHFVSFILPCKIQKSTFNQKSFSNQKSNNFLSLPFPKWGATAWRLHWGLPKRVQAFDLVNYFIFLTFLYIIFGCFRVTSFLSFLSFPFLGFFPRDRSSHIAYNGEWFLLFICVYICL